MYIRWFPWISSNKELRYLPLATMPERIYPGLKAKVRLKDQSTFLTRMLKNSHGVTIPSPRSLPDEFFPCVNPYQVNLPFYRVINGQVFGSRPPTPNRLRMENVFATTSVQSMVSIIDLEEKVASQKKEGLAPNLSVITIQPAVVRKPLPQEKTGNFQKTDSHEWVVVSGEVASTSLFTSL